MASSIVINCDSDCIYGVNSDLECHLGVASDGFYAANAGYLIGKSFLRTMVIVGFGVDNG